MLHLYLLEHGGNFCFIETIVLSCFTYIILRVLQNSMVVCFNNNRHTRLVKEKFLWVCWILWEVWCLIIVLRYQDGDIRVMQVEWLWIWEILVLNFVIPIACTYGEPLCDEVGAWFIYWLSSLWVAVRDGRWCFSTNPQLLTSMTLVSPSLYLKTIARNQTSHLFNALYMKVFIISLLDADHIRTNFIT